MTRITFEGFCDHESGWEYDLPIIVVKPKIYCSHDSSIYGIRDVVETLLDEMVAGKRLTTDRKPWPYSLSTIRRYHRLGKLGRARAGIAPFSVTAEVDLDGGWDAVEDPEGQPWKFIEARGEKYLLDVFDCKVVIA